MEASEFAQPTGLEQLFGTVVSVVEPPLETYVVGHPGTLQSLLSLPRLCQRQRDRFLAVDRQA